MITFQLCLCIHFLHIRESICLWKSDRRSTKNSWMWILEAAGHSMEICFQGFTLSSGEKKQLEEMYKISMLIQKRHPMDVDMRKPLTTLIPTTCLVIQRCTGCIFRKIDTGCQKKAASSLLLILFLCQTVLSVCGRLWLLTYWAIKPSIWLGMVLAGLWHPKCYNNIHRF